MLRQAVVTTLAVLSFSAIAGEPWVAPENLTSMIYQIPTSSYTTGSTNALGAVYLLRSDMPATSLSWDPMTVQEKLSYMMPGLSGMSLWQRYLNGKYYQSIDEINAGFRNQCVAFAKAVTGAGVTSQWMRGKSLPEIFPNAKVSQPWMVDGLLRPGTLIAHFGGKTSYDQNKDNEPHVAMVINVVADSYGNILGANVMDQNGMSSVSVNGSDVRVGDDYPGDRTTNGGILIKHFIPWNNTKSTRKTFSLKNYHVVTRP